MVTLAHNNFKKTMEEKYHIKDINLFKEIKFKKGLWTQLILGGYLLFLTKVMTM